MEKFYFTFGSAETFPYRYGWVEVFAPNRELAISVFRSRFPDKHEGFVNCSFIYSEEEFEKSGMAHSNFGEGCHETLFYKSGGDI